MTKTYYTTLYVHEYYMSQYTSNPLLMTTGSVVVQQVVVPQAGRGSLGDFSIDLEDPVF